jgi:hypothetical protein
MLVFVTVFYSSKMLTKNYPDTKISYSYNFVFENQFFLGIPSVIEIYNRNATSCSWFLTNAPESYVTKVNYKIRSQWSKLVIFDLTGIPKQFNFIGGTVSALFHPSEKLHQKTYVIKTTYSSKRAILPRLMFLKISTKRFNHTLNHFFTAWLASVSWWKLSKFRSL